MTQFISGGNNSSQMRSNCVIQIPVKKLVSSCFRKKLKKQQYEANEEPLIRQLRQRISEEQILKLQEQNRVEMQRSFRILKNKMKGSLKRKDSTVVKYFDGTIKQRSGLSSLMKRFPEVIDLRKKYEIKLNGKYNSVKQAREIQAQKSRYHIWLNMNNNSPINSPNYSKMNFILEKIQKSGDKNHILKPLEERKTDVNSLPISRVKNTEYSPKERLTHNQRIE